MASEDGTLLAIERQRVILDILQREGVVRNAELRELLGVSLVTIRSDLRELEKTGVCEIIWGGAVSIGPPTEGESQLSKRSTLNRDEKRRIGAAAAQMVEVGQTLMVDAGSTTVELIHALPHNLEYLRVVTPALNVAIAAAQFPEIEVVMPGGVLRHLTRSLIGPQTLHALELFNADWTFLATGGFTVESGVTTSNILEVEVKRTMVQKADRIALLADHTKFGRRLSLNVAPMSSIDLLITDHSLSDADVQQIEAQGVTVMRV